MCDIEPALKELTKFLFLQQVCISYCLSYIWDDRSTRQAFTKRCYKFTCNCIPCAENWPKMRGNVSIETALRDTTNIQWKCTKCAKALPKCVATKVNCQSCGKLNDIEKMSKKVNASITENFQVACTLISNQPKKALSLLLSHQCLLEEFIAKPSIFYVDCQEAIRNCYKMTGRRHEYNPALWA